MSYKSLLDLAIVEAESVIGPIQASSLDNEATTECFLEVSVVSVLIMIIINTIIILNNNKSNDREFSTLLYLGKLDELQAVFHKFHCYHLQTDSDTCLQLKELHDFQQLEELCSGLIHMGGTT
jgi:hypothetical protein